MVEACVPVVSCMIDSRRVFALEVGRKDGYVQVVNFLGNPVALVREMDVERIEKHFGYEGLALCCIEHGVQVGLVKLIVDIFWRDKDFLLSCATICKPELFVGEYGLSEATAPWSMMMRNAATELGSPERVLQVAKMSDLPWQVRVRLLKTVADNVEVAAQIIRECCAPTAVHAAADKTVRLKHTVDELEEYLGHNGPAALALGFASADKSDLAQLGTFANMSAAPKLAKWIEAYAAPPTTAVSK